MHLGGALPGKNLFMDYCHLNAEGIRVCMALAAQWLLAQIGPRRTAPLPALLAAAPEPTPETMAVACLHAAHHNWSWGQDRRILSYYCELSLRSHEIGEKMLRNFVDCQAQAAPAAICRAYYQLCRDVGPAVRYYVGLMFAERRKRSMIELLEAAAEALERRAVGTQQHLQRLLQRDHGVLSHPTNLLDEFYSSVSDGNPEDTPLMSREAQRTYYQAFSSRSAFFFVCERPAELILELTWRLVEPPLDAQGVSVEANDAVITVLPSSRIWKTARLRMPASLLREGVNHLIVRWPTPGDAWRRRLERFSAGLESGRPSPVYPVYGQLATLWVSVPLARHLDASCSASEPLRDGRDDYECAIERS
jgi:hypothetical protein